MLYPFPSIADGPITVGQIDSNLENAAHVGPDNQASPHFPISLPRLARRQLTVLDQIRMDLNQYQNRDYEGTDLVFVSPPSAHEILPALDMNDQTGIVVALNTGILALQVSASSNEPFLAHEVWLLETLIKVDRILPQELSLIHSLKARLLEDLHFEWIRLQNFKKDVRKQQSTRTPVSEDVEMDVLAQVPGGVVDKSLGVVDTCLCSIFTVWHWLNAIAYSTFPP